MPHLLGLLTVAAMLFGPSLWVRWALRRYGADGPDIRHSGAGLCNWLIAEHRMLGVQVEQTEQGDHYDPTTRTIRLSPQHYGRHSVTATAVALHEFGHALQHQAQYRPLAVRQQVVGMANRAERMASFALLLSPASLPVAPGAGRWLFLVGVLGMLLAIPVRFVTLPVEFDASFGRAMPLIREHGLLREDQMRGARTVLLACALTYAASALSGLLSVSRWLRVLMRR